MLEDFAIILGVGEYPTLGDNNSPANLRSPVEDARKVHKWLTTKGNVPPANVNMVITRQPANPADPSPREFELRKPFNDLLQLAAQRPGYLLGRRLYIYVAGHGISPGRQRGGAVLSADASSVDFANLFVSGWLTELRDAGYFAETVLWFDCCMDRYSTVPPSYPSIPSAGGQSAPGPNFTAFAAPRPLKAAEVMLPGPNPVASGAFTWALLDGLDGAAADRFGSINGDSLESWLRQAVYARLPTEALTDARIAKEPEFADSDRRIIFARGVTAKLFAVALSCPQAQDGSEVAVWGGAPLRRLVFSSQPVAQDGAATLKLAPGLYHAEVAGAGGTSFEVLRDCAAALDPTIEPLAPSDTLFRFATNYNDNSFVQQTLFGAGFEVIDHRVGGLSLDLPFGLYKLRSQLPRSLQDEIILLTSPRQEQAPVLSLVAVVPVNGAETSHEFHAEVRSGPGAVLALPRELVAGRARITLMLRLFSIGGEPVTVSEQLSKDWDKVTILGPSGAIVLTLGDLLEQGNDDPVIHGECETDAGLHRIRLRAAETTVEIALPVIEGYVHEVNVLRFVNADGTVDSRPRFSVMMRPSEHPQYSDGETSGFEIARIALADELPLMSKDLETLLQGKGDNPIGGVIGGHLLILAHEQGVVPSLEPLDVVVRNLRSLFGTENPDVEALSLRCPSAELRRTRPLRTPPTLARSWDLILEASKTNPAMVPPALARRLLAYVELPPFIAVNPSKDARDHVIADLANSINPPPLATFANAMSRPSSMMGSDKNLPPKLAPQPMSPGEREAAIQRAIKIGLAPSAVDFLS